MKHPVKSKLSETPLVHDGAVVKGSTLGRFVEIGANARLTEVGMDDYAYCDRFAEIAYSQVGKFANIAAFARVNPGNHPTWRASLHHFMYRSSAYFEDEPDEAELFEWRRETICVLGADTWLGNGAQVLPGRVVGTGSVVGAGAIVTKDVPCYAIVAGNPAQVIKMRFPDPVIERLLALKWWDWSHEALHFALPDFRKMHVEAFLEKYEDAAGRR